MIISSKLLVLAFFTLLVALFSSLAVFDLYLLFAWSCFQLVSLVTLIVLLWNFAYRNSEIRIDFFAASVAISVRLLVMLYLLGDLEFSSLIAFSPDAFFGIFISAKFKDLKPIGKSILIAAIVCVVSILDYAFVRMVEGAFPVI